MNTVIICGSHRSPSQGMKVSQYIQKIITGSGGKAEMVNLSHSQLPLWDEGMWNDDPKWQSVWSPIEDKLKAADSLVVVSPEYAGMASAALKNFFLFVTGDLIAHKPAMIVTVTASFTNGAYPNMELRGSSYKNCKILYTPDHVIVRSAEMILNEIPLTSESPNFKLEQQTDKRIRYSLNTLQVYEEAMKAVRSSGKINLNEFSNGM